MILWTEQGDYDGDEEAASYSDVGEELGRLAMMITDIITLKDEDCIDIAGYEILRHYVRQEADLLIENLKGESNE